MQMTRTGTVMGTPFYMSPEQARGSKQLDHRSDLYAMGVILYEAVTGHRPFDGETFNELLFKIALSDPVPIREHASDVDPQFEAIVIRAMAREPEQRFQSADDLIAALDAWDRQAPTAIDVIPPVAASDPPTVVAAQLRTATDWTNTGAVPQNARRLGIIGAAVLSGVFLLVAGAFAIGRIARGNDGPAPATSEFEPAPTGSVESPPVGPEAPIPPPPPAEAEPAASAPVEAAASAKPKSKLPRRPRAAPAPSAKAPPSPAAPNFGY
jgi:serine/threonine-protein kinase